MLITSVNRQPTHEYIDILFQDFENFTDDLFAALSQQCLSPEASPRLYCAGSGLDLSKCRCPSGSSLMRAPRTQGRGLGRMVNIAYA